MQQQYGLDTSAFSYDPTRGGGGEGTRQGQGEAAMGAAEHDSGSGGGRCTVM